MPNVNNIESPFTLISYGRSGSSLLSKVFELHPDFAVIGETGNFTANLWKALEFSSGTMAPLIESGKWLADDERAGRMVRASFRECFQDEKPHWFHKPIGVPIALSQRFNDGDWDGAATWFWNMYRTAFPKAKYFTILRHPLDTVLSAKAFWGYDDHSIWVNYERMLWLLLHPAAPIEYAVSYEQLSLDGEKSVRSLFEFLGIRFSPDVMTAFATIHAAAPGRASSGAIALGRRAEWASLDKEAIRPKCLEMALSLYRKFGQTLRIPPEFLEAPTKAGVNPAAAYGAGEQCLDPAIKKILSEKNRQVERLHSDNARAIAEKEREFHNIFAEDQRWIVELEEGKQFLASENASLRSYMEELQQGITWLESERDNWLREFNAVEGQNVHLSAALEEQQKATEWFASQQQEWAEQVAALTTELGTVREEQQKAAEWFAGQQLAWERQLAILRTDLSTAREEQQRAGDWYASQRDAWEALVRQRDAELANTIDMLKEHASILERIRSSTLMRIANRLAGKKYF